MPEQPLSVKLARRVLSGALGVVLASASFVFLLWPGIELARALGDHRLVGPEPSSQSWRWHRALSPAFARWAAARRDSGAAAALSIDDISGTEWPLFGALFYLRATENLDQAWLKHPHGERPAVYARHAIDATADLLADPGQSAWVQEHWGAAHYLSRENVFYRVLLIDGLATQRRMTGERRHLSLLGAQVEGLAAELSASRTGLLADYPGQTFPADVAAAWHAIRRADPVLGTDHRSDATMGLRGFVDHMAPELGLPPFAWYGNVDAAPTEVRGSGNAWLLLNAAFVWPEQAKRWRAANNSQFWHESPWLAGYREFARSHRDEVYSDVDSGPVIAELGTSATAFGLGAARSVGDFREARVIALEMIAASLPLPNGRLLVPRLLSDATDAPLLGEAAILHNLSQPAAPGFDAQPASLAWGDVPGIVWLVLVLQLGLGAGGIWRGIGRIQAAARP